MRVELHAFAVTSGPSYDYVQMLEDDEGLKFIVTGTNWIEMIFGVLN